MTSLTGIRMKPFVQVRSRSQHVQQENKTA